MEEDPSKPKKYHYTYEITNIYNGMRYIGARSSKVPPEFDTKYMSSSRHLKKAIKEEGLDHFIKVILQEFSTRKEALEQEICLHNKFNVNKNPIFYNKAKQTSTGFDFQAYGPDNHNYGKPRTEEVKEKLRQKNMGHPGTFKGKHHTEKTKELLKQQHLGKKLTKEHKRNIGDAARGKTRSSEARKNQSKIMSGKNNPMYGKPISQETRNKRSVSVRESRQNDYIYITPIGEFSSSSKAAKALQCSKHAIIERCKKKFEGYFLIPVENKYKRKKEELERLLEQGHSIPEIEKIMKVHNATLLRWKHEKEGTEPNGVGIKLNATKVLEIRYLFDLGVPVKVLQKEFDLGKTQVFRIGKRKSWSHIPEESHPTPIDPSWQKNYCC